MSDHENIQHPDTHQFGDSLQKQLAMLRAEYKYLEQKYDRVCSDLNAIINRVQSGDEVYVVMKDGSNLYLTEDKSKAE